ncbi:hypothetical protein FA95DRAFT_1529454, partial [Auriscalpium vulgare]
MFRKAPNVKGFKIPGLLNKLVINLFADDTLLYLSAEDKYEDVTEILSRWCAASGAKFNILKTEIIPIGTPEHRANVVATRKLNENDDPISNEIKITEDGQSARYLGTWVGNDADDAIPWGPVLDKINAYLTRWKQTYPSIMAKKHIVQMFAGGCSQFLAKAQGMPKQTEEALIKLIKNFIWSEDTRVAPIDLKHLYRPKEQGGIDLLDIKARNDAIELMWLKDYLDLTETRP